MVFGSADAQRNSKWIDIVEHLYKASANKLTVIASR
jgi:hypothetical protein